MADALNSAPPIAQQRKSLELSHKFPTWTARIDWNHGGYASLSAASTIIYKANDFCRVEERHDQHANFVLTAGEAVNKKLLSLLVIESCEK